MARNLVVGCTPGSGTPVNSNITTGEPLIETALELFRVAERDQSEGGISDQHLLALHNLFQEHLLLQALELVDQTRVTCCVCQTVPTPGETGPLPREAGPIPGETGPIPGETGPIPGETGPIPGRTGPLPEETCFLPKGQNPPGTAERTQWTWEKAVCAVKGTSNKDYVCCISSSSSSVYCSCPSFIFSVKRRKEAIMCKHLLASCVGLATHTCLYQSVDEHRWAELWQPLAT